MSVRHRAKVGEFLRDGWAKPEKSTRLSPGDVQIWRLDLSTADGASWVEAGWDLLSSEEVARARRMRLATSRDEQLAGRAALRSLLARELGCDARELKFVTGKHGKPFLECGNLAFNVGHSQGMILIALSRAGAVGVDVEDSARPVEALDVARTAFHPDEIRWLLECPETQRIERFYRCWTRKEAVVKADGRGLMLSSKSFSVIDATEIAGGVMAMTVVPSQNDMSECEQITDDESNLDTYDQNRYHLVDLNPGRGFVGALALGRRICSIAQYDFYPARDL